MSRIRKSLLDSGIKVITEEMPEVESSTIGIWVTTGSRNETPEVNGVSHFIEHLLFKGTVDEIFHHPVHPYTRGLLGSVIHMESTALSWIDGLPPDLADAPPGCPYAERCDERDGECRRGFPAETRLSPTHRVNCFRAGRPVAEPGRDGEEGDRWASSRRPHWR